MLIGGEEDMLHADWRRGKHAAYWLEERKTCCILIGGEENMLHTDWRRGKHAAYWLKERKTCCMLIGGEENMLHADWRRGKHAAYWLKERKTCCILIGGVLICRKWTSQAFMWCQHVFTFILINMSQTLTFSTHAKSFSSHAGSWSRRLYGHPQYRGFLHMALLLYWTAGLVQVKPIIMRAALVWTANTLTTWWRREQNNIKQLKEATSRNLVSLWAHDKRTVKLK